MSIASAQRAGHRRGHRSKRANEGSFPGFIAPCDPTLRVKAPMGAEWIHEIKLDGYRAQLHLHRGEVVVYSRSGYDWSEQFAPIAEAANALAAKSLIIDGEAVVLGATGLPDFQALRRELRKEQSQRLQYYAFDLLYLDGQDLRAVPLMERKSLLCKLLRGAPPVFVYVEHFDIADGNTIVEHACKLGLEGVVSKRREAPYRSGRQETWIKVKCSKSDTFPIVAFVEKLGASPRRIASLYVGRHEGNKLLYGGKARSGYTESTARYVRERLDPLIIRKSPLSEPVKKPKATWVKPVVQAEIQFGGKTDDGLLREAVFKGLRDDLAGPPAPRLEKEGKQQRPRKGGREAREQRAYKGRGGVPRENILQLLPDAVAPSKEELRVYWRRVARRALAYIGRRPLKLVRHTRGTIFYHMGPLPPIPPSVHSFHIEKREGGEGTRVWVDDLDGLLGLVNMDVVEVHPWAATVDDIEHPDRLVLDLDPAETVPWDFVAQTAFKLRELLNAEGLSSWPKLSGGKGVHVMVPVEGAMTHDGARVFCRRLAQRIAATDAARYTLSSAPGDRVDRIYLDYLRNGRGTTAVGAYSPRVRPGFPIAAPISWSQLERGIRPDSFAMDHPFRAR